MIEAPYGYPPFDTPKAVAEGVWVVDAKPIRALLGDGRVARRASPQSPSGE